MPGTPGYVLITSSLASTRVTLPSASLAGLPTGSKLNINFNVRAFTIDICAIEISGYTALGGKNLKQVLTCHTDFDFLRLFETVSHPFGVACDF